MHPRRSFYAQRVAEARIAAGAHRRSGETIQRIDGTYWHPKGELIEANERSAAAFTTLYHREMGWTR